MREWKRITVIALGIGSLVAGALLPAAATPLIAAGVGLLGWALPAPAAKRTRRDELPPADDDRRRRRP